MTIDGSGSLIFDSSSVQHLSSVGTSDFDFTHDGNTVFSMTLDLVPPPDGGGSVLSLGSNRIINLEDPINDLDAVNKRYLESYIPVDEYVHKTKDNVISGDNQFVSPHDDINVHILGATGPSVAGNKAGTLQFIGGGNPGESIAKIVVNKRLGPTGTPAEFVDVSLNTSNEIVSNFKTDIIKYEDSAGSALFTIKRSGNPLSPGENDRVQYHGEITEGDDIINKEYGELNYLSKTDVKVGRTDTLSAGNIATVSVTAPATFNFGIPKGNVGATGTKGNTGATGAGSSGNFVKNGGASNTTITITKNSSGVYTISGG